MPFLEALSVTNFECFAGTVEERLAASDADVSSASHRNLLQVNLYRVIS